MQSFRTELELIPDTAGQAIVERDVLELAEKIRRFREGRIDPEKFRSLRLARGVYGQRQPGVQMVRIKVPYGKLSPQQLRRVAALSDEFSTGNLHLTTRQDIQLHFVSLDRTPELWTLLEQHELTIREACGNTVRNVTASPTAGIDPNEPFDVTPYADALFRYFLRHPAGQDMGRKIKIAFAASDADTAFTFIHDVGFLPRVEIIRGQLVRGFKVVVGGGLGAQPFLAQTAFEFLPGDEIIPFTETLLRVFDRYGERNNRHKARLKYLVQQLGLQEVLRLAENERTALPAQKIPVEIPAPAVPPLPSVSFTTFRVSSDPRFLEWRKSNVFAQKQDGWFGVYVLIPQGNLSSEKARRLAEITEQYISGDLRVTPGQSLLLRFVPAAALPALFHVLQAIDLAQTGANAFADLTSCPGTDTCNLGISNSTGVAAALEKVIREEFPQLVAEQGLSIRISGCMNSCGQHGLAHIGFHGSSLKAGGQVVPALQLLLGGGVTGSGNGRIAEKVIKFPSRRAPVILRTLLADLLVSRSEGETFHAYFDRRGKNYFYQLLRPFADLSTVADEELIDWNQEGKFETAIGVGECAGAKIDLVSTLLGEAEEALEAAEENYQAGHFADAIYKAYNAFIHAAKALLLRKGVTVNSQLSVVTAFDSHFTETGEFVFSDLFVQWVFRINQHAPEKSFAREYIRDARAFVAKAHERHHGTTEPRLN